MSESHDIRYSINNSNIMIKLNFLDILRHVNKYELKIMYSILFFSHKKIQRRK